jgi:hypothetical protein
VTVGQAEMSKSSTEHVLASQKANWSKVMPPQITNELASDYLPYLNPLYSIAGM